MSEQYAKFLDIPFRINPVSPPAPIRCWCAQLHAAGSPLTMLCPTCLEAAHVRSMEALRSEILHLQVTNESRGHVADYALHRAEQAEAFVETLRSALVTYGQHTKDCKTHLCASCGYRQWMHDWAEDFDAVTCLVNGKYFTARADCTCGFTSTLSARAASSPQEETR